MRTRATLGLNLVYITAWASLLSLPGIYDDLSESLGLSTEECGRLQTAKLCSMFISLPFYGYLSYFFSRRRLLAGGLLIGGCIGMASAGASSYQELLLCQFLGGLSLGGVLPLSRSLISTYYALETRGAQYGLLETSSGIGGFMGVGLATYIGSWWQTMLAVNTLLLAASFLCTLGMVVDPIFDGGDAATFPGLTYPFMVPTRTDLRSFLSKKTYLCILLQGVFGAFAWPGLTFLIQWFERMGVSRGKSIAIFAAVGIGQATGGLFGGRLGDWAARYYRESRVAIGHFSVMIGIPLVSCFLFALPRDPVYWWAYVIFGKFFGFCISWPAANISAVQSDIVPQHLHSISFGLQLWVEGTASALSPAVVGYLASEVFKIKALALPEEDWGLLGSREREDALDGMASSLVVLCILCWGACSLFYWPMYYYYTGESISAASLDG